MGVEYRNYVLPVDRSYRPNPERLALLLATLVDAAWLPASAPPRYPTPDEAPILDEESQTSAPFAWAYRLAADEPLPFPLAADWLTAISAYDASLHWQIDDYTHTALRFPFSARPNELPYCHITVHLPIDYAYDPDLTVYDPRGKGGLAGLLNRLRSEAPAPSAVACICGARLDYKLPHWSYSTEWRIHATCFSCHALVDPSRWPATCRDGYGSRSRITGGSAYRFAFILDCEKAIPGAEGAFGVHPELLDLVAEQLGAEVLSIPHYY